ncbi:Alpha/Beta hydrolase protein [Schizophyllum amplum]|uniref:Alpha/Beta hydrolase protein n=1 Tax=Schizophyllum amplum TaxID=97359 RepID=A0A550CJS3_9AGAR|nr:Alpha/Beta hydrolase protein [Auriculariopsis ampla]
MSSSLKKFLSEPFEVQWRTAVLRLPRAVPDQVLRYTSYEGPHPFVLKLPSRGRYSIPVYVFVPPTEPPPEGYPVIIDFHGGGFVMGSCLEQAPFCAKMARDLGALVITVDYRMGPIDKFPAAVEDGEDVLSAILDPSAPGYAALRAGIADRVKRPAAKPLPIDTTRLAIAGFSSGGNLALNLALSIAPPQVETPWPSRIPPGHPRRVPLLLYYPSFDARQLPSERTCPPKMPASKTFWRESFDILHQTYLPREQAGHPRASPGLADLSALHEQARMYLVLPELDSLAEQSEVWVKKVEEEGRAEDLKVTRVKGMRHGWTQMPVSWLDDEEKRTREETFVTAVQFVKDAWDGPDAPASAMGNLSA